MQTPNDYTPVGTDNLFRPGDAITAKKLNQLAREVFETVEVGPGLTKKLVGDTVIIATTPQAPVGSSITVSACTWLAVT